MPVPEDDTSVTGIVQYVVLFVGVAVIDQVWLLALLVWSWTTISSVAWSNAKNTLMSTPFAAKLLTFKFAALI